jgi:hypothetical protein
MKHLLLFGFILCTTFATSFAQTEMVSNGTFEDTIRAPWGSWAADAATIDYFRVADQAYEGTHSAKIWDHTWGVMLWNDAPGFSDNANYTVSFWYKGAEPMKYTLAIGRDLGYDLVTDADKIVPAGATVEKIGTTENGRLTWPLPAVAEWTKFTYTFNIKSWLGKDPESGEPISGVCAFMFENTSYKVDGGPSSFIDNVSIIKKDGLSSSANVSKPSIQLFPNPASNYIQISGCNTVETVQIVNIAGQVVKRIQHPVSNTIDVSYLSSGIYHVSILTEKEGRFVSKFVKE